MATPPLAPRPAKRPPAPHLHAAPLPLLEPEFDAGPIIRATRPDTPHVRAPRLLDSLGELVAGLVLIVGGVFAYGFMPIG
ncbi:hypothetical protein ASG52_25285 [Methylobacterium sp. Leaf456]|uniref:hypothetical protein n=1 Tax=Methylobacterium sp. Leaf456 TaxID=1736382 RepID=UPI0006FE3BE7|nr:hypothetical protein [Methylobacterium sp. Leaf456]KQT55040.1 hypothetical protein ASG52_25285 [Methylobacterium sp. Leaf456]